MYLDWEEKLWVKALIKIKIFGKIFDRLKKPSFYQKITELFFIILSIIQNFQ